MINALNRDLPYDQFIIEQIAGDLLPNATQDQIVATGFLRNSMINEEGGIDPEQFRMEAMFDRMDAIGKGILGLTIQCAQCHNHKYDPLTQEEYYRMFAFLNNTHEANIAVYTPDEQMKRAEIFRRIARDRGRAAAPQSRLARADGGMGGAGQRTTSRSGRCSGPTVDDISTGGQKYLPMPDGSLPGAGLRADQAHASSSPSKTDLHEHHRVPPGAAERSEPAAAAARADRIKGTVRADRVRSRSRAGRRARARVTKIKFASATADFNLPETPLEADLRRQERQAARHRARSTSPSTARTRPPGASTPARAAQSAAQGRLRRRDADRESRAARILTFYLKQNHGGWNSDDNQNNNLGRFRLSITTAPNAVADPLPQRRARDPRHPARRALARADRGRLQLLADDRARVEGGQRRDRGALEASIPRARRNWCSQAREQPRETHMLKRGDFLKPGQASSTPGVPAFLHPLPAGRSAQPADVRPMAGRPQVAHHGALDREPRLAGLFRHRHRRHQRRISARSASRRRIPSCSTGWPSSSWITAGA